jgi:hypothetical protein
MTHDKTVYHLHMLVLYYTINHLHKTHSVGKYFRCFIRHRSFTVSGYEVFNVKSCLP